MNKISIFLLAISFLAVLSCTKERLIIQENELEFDENSSEYQAYQAERAMEYIRMFRFEKLDDILDKLNDPAVLKNLQDSLRKYRSIAETQALYVVTPENDSLFFIPPQNDNPTLGDEIWLGANFLANYTTMPNARGVVQGFKNYPKTTILHFFNHLATGAKGMEELPDLKIFRWLVRPADVSEAFPDEEFAYVPLQVDLSNNHKLEEVNVGGIKLGNIIFPNHQLQSFNTDRGLSAGGSEYPTGSLDGLWAKAANISGLADLDFKMTNVRSDSLVFTPAVKTLDISETDIQAIRAAQVEHILLNDGLKRLWLPGGKLLSKPIFPQDLEELELTGYTLSDKDFSAITNLKKIIFGSRSFEGLVLPERIENIIFYIDRYNGSSAGISHDYSHLSRLKKIRIEGSDIDQTGLVFPQNLEHLSFHTNVQGHGDYSNLYNLTTFEATASLERMPSLPDALTKLHMQFFNLTENTTIDLGNLTNLTYLYLYARQDADKPFTLILPNNLSEAAAQAVNHSVNGNASAFYLPTGSTILNKPSWFDQYVTYY